LSLVTAIFYGVSPAVIALILHSCFRLAKLGMEDTLQWVLAAACFVITLVLQSEVALLFIGAGVIGMLYYGTLARRLFRRPPILAGLPVLAATPAQAATMSKASSKAPTLPRSGPSWVLASCWVGSRSATGSLFSSPLPHWLFYFDGK
jgi:chromate transporter